MDIDKLANEISDKRVLGANRGEHIRIIAEATRFECSGGTKHDWWLFVAILLDPYSDEFIDYLILHNPRELSLIIPVLIMCSSEIVSHRAISETSPVYVFPK